MTKIPLRPPHPERICWGCDKYCPADDLACGNGTIRTLHPCELFGDDWYKAERREHADVLAPPFLAEKREQVVQERDQLRDL